MSNGKSESYKPWGPEDCYRLGADEKEPCWGRVQCIDDGVRDWGMIEPTYACEGHTNWPFDYYPEEKGKT